MEVKRYLSLSVLVLMCFVLFRVATLYPRWQNQAGEATLSWDVFGYYLYLPAAFIYDDLAELKFTEEIMSKYSPSGDFHHSTPQEDGRQVLKYPIGMSVVYLPFFVLAHIFAGLTDYAADGFSLPYQYAISMGALLYAF